ncbi:MAG: dephospho-CoA kinase [Clostridia bacterium]
MKSTLVVGLTGGLGSGKSTVADLVRERKIPVVDADRLAREVVRPRGEAYGPVVEEFGRGILNEDGCIDRARLAAIVFQNAKSRRRLERLIHPPVVRRMVTEIDRARERGEPVIVLDVPLLFEVGLEDLCDRTWVVWAREDQRIRRLATRDGMDPEDVRLRMQAQMSLEEKMDLADVVIDNSGSLEDTRRRVELLLDDIVGQGAFSH